MPMVIKTKLKETEKKGLGLFAVENINKGDVVYVDDYGFDKIIKKEEMENFHPVLKDFIKKYASYNKEMDSYYLCADDARFWNHSDNPNTNFDAKSGKIYANRNILAGEELTTDYREFDDYSKDGDFGFEIIND